MLFKKIHSPVLHRIYTKGVLGVYLRFRFKQASRFDFDLLNCPPSPRGMFGRLGALILTGI